MVIFQDDFRNGLIFDANHWTGQVTTLGESIQALSTPDPHLLISCDGSDWEEDAYIYKTLAQFYETLHLQAKVTIRNTLPPHEGRQFNPLAICSSARAFLISSEVYNSAGINYWAFRYFLYNPATDVFAQARVISSIPVTLGTEYTVQVGIYVNETAGWLRLWIDGILVGEMVGINTNRWFEGGARSIKIGEDFSDNHIAHSIEVREVVTDVNFIPLVPTPTHTLNVDSNPITGVTFTTNGVQKTTPYSETLDEGIYTVVMPVSVQAGVDIYNFVKWEDESIDPTRSVNLVGDTAIIAYYELAPPPPTHVLSVQSTPVQEVPFVLERVS